MEKLTASPNRPPIFSLQNKAGYSSSTFTLIIQKAMIAQLYGRIDETVADSLVVDVHIGGHLVLASVWKLTLS